MPWKGLFLTKKLIFSTSINPEVYRRNEHNETVRCLCSWFFFFSTLAIKRICINWRKKLVRDYPLTRQENQDLICIILLAVECKILNKQMTGYRSELAALLSLCFSAHIGRRVLRRNSLVSRLSILPRCPRDVWERVGLSPSVTSQFTGSWPRW